MKKIKVSEASGAVLDWMVAKCEAAQTGTSYVFTSKGKLFINSPLNPKGPMGAFQPSARWTQGGPIIERELIDVQTKFQSAGALAPKGRWYWQASVVNENDVAHWIDGPTFLIAAMRCYVASKLGDLVEVPEELIG